MTRRDRYPSDKGMFAVGGIIFMAVLAIVVQAMVYWTKMEARLTLKEQQTTSAFHLAEAGYNRALWKLKERSSNFDDVMSGTPASGYEGAHVYTDVQGGTYTVAMSSGPLEEQITVRATGTSRKGERRTIEAVLDRRTLTGPLTVPQLSFTGGAEAIWGPILSTGNLDFQGTANQLYPRKYARGSVNGNGSYGSRDTNPTAPNTDGLEWFAYNHPPGVPDIPEIDLNYYRGVAQSQGLYFTAPPLNRNITNLVDTNANAVRFYEGNVKFAGNKFFRGVLIVMGDLEFAGGAKTPEGYVTATPPSNAWEDYQKNTPSSGISCGGGGGAGASNDGSYSNNANAEGDKACTDQYPGDAGLHAVEDFVIGQGCVSHNHLGGTTGTPASFQGLIYVRGQIKGTGNTAIHGAVIVADGGAWGGGGFEVFYDPTVQPVTDDDGTVDFIAASWREVVE